MSHAAVNMSAALGSGATISEGGAISVSPHTAAGEPVIAAAARAACSPGRNALQHSSALSAHSFGRFWPVHLWPVLRCRPRTGVRTQRVRTFGTTAGERLALRDWLEAHGVTHVAMESTGVY